MRGGGLAEPSFAPQRGGMLSILALPAVDKQHWHVKGRPEDYGIFFFFFGMLSDNLINTKLNLSDFDARF